MLSMSQILAALPKLNDHDLKAVSATAQSILAARTGATAALAGTLQAMTFDALSAALNGTASLSTLPAPLVRRFERHLPDFRQFLDKDFKGWDEKKIRQKAFLLMLFELLREYLISIEIKPTYNTMVNTMPRMGEVFDSAFPGYRVAGWGHVILNRFDHVDLPDKKNVGKSKVKAMQRG